MKSYVKLVCALFAVTAVLPLCGAEGTVKVAAANVRLKPTTSAAVVARLKSGEKVEIISGNSDWLEIKAPSVFVAKNLIDDGKTRPGVRLRAGAGTNFPILGVLRSATPVKVLGEGATGDWVRIEAPEGIRAYIAADLVTGGKDVPALAGGSKSAGDKKSQTEAKSADKPDQRASGQPFADLPVKDGSARQVTVEGMLFPLKDAGSGVKFALAQEGKTEYVVRYFVHTGGSSRFKHFANKRVKLVGISYDVPNWDTKVLKVNKIIPVE